MDMDPKAQHVVLGCVHSLAKSYPVVDMRFEELFAAWKSTWSSEEWKFSSHSKDRAQGVEYDALITYGRTVNILPQIVAKLSGTVPKFAVMLYNELQTDDSKKVPETDVLNYSSLNAESVLIQKYYAAFIGTFNDMVERWKAHHAASSFSSWSQDYLDHASYDDLVKLGKPIVPLVMERYAHDQSGWWHELLHEVVYGGKSDARSFKKSVLFEEWKKFYESGDT